MWILLYLLFVHFIADFVLQTDEMAVGKSRSWSWLLIHTFTYTMVMMLGVQTLLILGTVSGVRYGLLFGLITFVAHTLQDAITSRINARLYLAGRRHDFFVGVGADQWLHTAQLAVTWFSLFGAS